MIRTATYDLWDARDIQEFVLAAKCREELEEDDADDDADGVDFGAGINSANA